MIGAVAAGLLAGLVLGLLGAGGTVVGLPVLLYLTKLTPHKVLGTNALGVAVTAVALFFWRLRRGEVRIREGLLFTVPGLAGIYAGVRLGLVFPGESLVFLLGALLFFVAGWIYYLSTREAGGGAAAGGESAPSTALWLRLGLTAFAVGGAAGFFAIGGGFMIVPGLMLAGGLELGAAAAAALIPISAFASLVGFEYLRAGSVDLPLFMAMVMAGLMGGGMGIWLSGAIPKRALQRVFAVFLALLGTYMLFR